MLRTRRLPNGLFFLIIILISSQGFAQGCLKSIEELVIPNKVIKLGGTATSLEVSPDGNFIEVGLADGRLLEFDPNGNLLSSAQIGNSNAMATWSGNSPIAVSSNRKVVRDGLGVYCCSSPPLAIASNGDKIAVATADRKVELIDAVTLKKIKKLSSPNFRVPRYFRYDVTSVAFSPKGDKLVVSYFRKGDVQIVAYETKTGEILYSGEIANANLAPDLQGKWDKSRSAPSVSKIAFTGDGEGIVAAYRSYLDGKSQSWIGKAFLIPLRNPEEAKAIETVNDDAREQYVRHALDTDTKVGNDGELMMLGLTGAMGPSYSPVGKPWVIKGKLPQAIIYKKKGSEFVPALRLLGHSDRVDFVRFGADGSVITIGADNLLVVWNVTNALSTGKAVGIFQGGMSMGITNSYNGGIPFPVGQLYALPPNLQWERGTGGSIQGMLVDESFAGLLY